MCASRSCPTTSRRAALEEAPDLAESVGRIRGILVREGARLAPLSGSGSSFFGLFDDAPQAAAPRRRSRRPASRPSAARTLSLDQYRRDVGSGRLGGEHSGQAR